MTPHVPVTGAIHQPGGRGPVPRVLYTHPDLGRIYLPRDATRLVSLPGRPARAAYGPGEMGIVVATHHRPVRVDGVLRAMQLLWASITHNERVDRGAVIQDARCFGSGGTVFTAVAVANATLTKDKADESLGTTTADSTANEFTGTGLARAAGSLGTYTAPTSLGGTFSRVITRTFTATGNATARGSGLFDSTTVSGSRLYVEDNFSSEAVLVNGDTLTINWTITN